ncbi:hypothetical protein [Moheibacter lacus]|uniref:Uncharacterized protein n=1 Tax=Moheibacter lacus TaxID=2745851 RepID=A0A838ZSV1_9FLAO|nr:hypothetical protein [Moheibacter lacus]MBA5630065.1 hypothetical protein [Moheibacter lacus]
MKKMILLSVFGLMGTFAFANLSEEISHKVEYAPEGGWCTVTIFNVYGNPIYTETSWQSSEAACHSWASGKVYEFITQPIAP